MTPDYSPARALLASARRNPDRRSLVDAVTGEEWSVREAAATVARLAAAFEEVGVDEGTRIAVIGANSPWHYIVHVAASWVFLDEASRAHASALSDAGAQVASFADLSAWADRATPIGHAPARCGTELAAILFTSGSTGIPRPVELTHEVMWWGSTNFREGFDYAPTSSVVGARQPHRRI